MNATQEQIQEMSAKYYEAAKAGTTYSLSEKIQAFFGIRTLCLVMAGAQELAEKDGRTFDSPFFALIQA